MPLQNQADRSDHCERSQDEKHKERLGHLAPHCIRARITKLVRMTFRMETGKSNFQPKAINWS